MKSKMSNGDDTNVGTKERGGGLWKSLYCSFCRCWKSLLISDISAFSALHRKSAREFGTLVLDKNVSLRVIYILPILPSDIVSPLVLDLEVGAQQILLKRRGRGNEILFFLYSLGRFP